MAENILTTISQQDVDGGSSYSEGRLSLILFHSIIKCLICAITLLGNALTIIVFIKFPNLRRTSNWFLVSLAVSDLLSGIMMVLHVPDFNACDVIAEDLVTSLSHLTVMTSLVHLLLIAIDRYIAIAHPLHYDSRMTPKRAGILIASTWIIITVACCSPLFAYVTLDISQCKTAASFIYYLLLELSLYIIIMITVTIIYANILLVVRRQQKKIHHSETFTASGTRSGKNNDNDDATNTISGHVSDLHPQANHDISDRHGRNDCHNNREPHGRQIGIKARKINRPVLILLVLILALFVLWAPYMLYIVLAMTRIIIPSDAFRVLLTIGFVNSAVNTFVYAIISKEFRDAYKKTIKCWN